MSGLAAPPFVGPWEDRPTTRHLALCRSLALTCRARTETVEPLDYLLDAFIGLLALLLLAVVRRRREWRPLLVFVACLFVTNLIRTSSAWEAIFAGSTSPYEGPVLVALLVDRLLFVSPDFLFVWACGALFQARWARVYALVGLTLVAGAVTIGYPSVGVDEFGIVVVAYAVANLLVMWVASLRAALGQAKVKPELAHLAFLVLLATDSVVNLYGWVDQIDSGLDGMTEQWDITAVLNVLSFGFAIVVVTRVMFLTRATTRPRQT